MSIDLTGLMAGIVKQLETRFTNIEKKIEGSGGSVVLKKDEKEAGLLLDMSRKFYNYNEIIAFVDFLGEIKADYFILHFSDNENYAIESELMGQTTVGLVANSDGSYTNPNTGKNFITKEQFKGICDRCLELGIEFIPEVNFLAHCGGIYQLSLHNDFKKFNKKVTPEGESSIFINDNSKDKYETSFAFINGVFTTYDHYSPQGKTFLFAQSLMEEIIGYLNGNIKRFHVGADEFNFAYDWAYEHYEYLIKLGDWLIKQNIKPIIWNDGVVHDYLYVLPRYFDVIFWQWYGYATDTDYTELKSHRLTFPEIADRGHRIYNANDYYCYSVPKGNDVIVNDANYAANDAKNNWSLGKWDSNRQGAVPVTDNMVGSLMAIWCENVEDTQNGTDVLSALKPHIKAIVDKTKNRV